MKRTFVIALAILFLLTACQATPDAPIVVQKDMEQMIEKAQKTPISTETMPDDGERYPLLSRLGAPERYTAYITPVGERLTMDIDAVVRIVITTNSETRIKSTFFNAAANAFTP